jgi:hypothetical protein
LNTYKGFADNNFAFESTYKYKFYIINWLCSLLILCVIIIWSL